MYQRRWISPERWRKAASATQGLALIFIAASALAQTPAPTTPGPDAPTLRMAYEAAWARQPEAAALSARR
jgi:cobalt-zinc-cadmium efflux system outer membrane protein